MARWETAHETQYLFWGAASAFMMSSILVGAANSDRWTAPTARLSTILIALGIVCIVAAALAKRRMQRKGTEVA